MNIRIAINRKEVMDIVKEYVVKTFPGVLSDREVDVTESYGSFTVNIEDKKEQVEEVAG